MLTLPTSLLSQSRIGPTPKWAAADDDTEVVARVWRLDLVPIDVPPAVHASSAAGLAVGTEPAPRDLSSSETAVDWQTFAVHSPDGSWWWDGRHWRAVSPDGRYWHDGTNWHPRKGSKSTFRRPVPRTAIVVASIAATMAALAFCAWTMGDAHDARSLDDDRIWEAATTGCREVTSALDQAHTDRLSRITTGNAAIAALVTGVEELGEDTLSDDEPALDWVNDWRALAAARAELGDHLIEGTTAPFRVPETDDGYPITDRMIDVSPPECESAVNSASQP